MAEATFLDQKSVRPGSAAIVILLHGAALAALLLAKSEFVDEPRTRTQAKLIEIDRPPPPPPPPPTDEVVPPRHPLEFTAPPTPLPLPRPGPIAVDPPVQPPDLGATDGPEVIRNPVPQPEPRPADPPAPPVRVDAQLDRRSELQPPYPAAEQRAQREGQVVIRVTIGANGRVIAASRVSATSDAFYRATESHARARWRFRPATVDGRPVESQRTMTVFFRIEDA